MHTGDLVEEFTLNDDGGASVSLGALIADGPVVLFFYPGAMTRGCTAEACHFRDLSGEFAAAGARPVGVSMDSVDTQRRFSKLHGLPFPLLSDPSGTVARQFGVRRKLTRLLPVRRATFVIGRDRRIIGIVRSELRMDEHADRALAIVKDAGSSV